MCTTPMGRFLMVPLGTCTSAHLYICTPLLICGGWFGGVHLPLPFLSFPPVLVGGVLVTPGNLLLHPAVAGWGWVVYLGVESVVHVFLLLNPPGPSGCGGLRRPSGVVVWTAGVSVLRGVLPWVGVVGSAPRKFVVGCLPGSRFGNFLDIFRFRGLQPACTRTATGGSTARDRDGRPSPPPHLATAHGGPRV